MIHVAGPMQIAAGKLESGKLFEADRRIRDGVSHFLHNRPDDSETTFAGRQR
jgi:hypothetical protein